MQTIYTRISDNMNGLIDALALEEGKKKADIIRDLLKKGFEANKRQADRQFSESGEVEIQIPLELYERLEGMKQRFHYNDISSLLEGLAISDLCLLRRQFEHGA